MVSTNLSKDSVKAQASSLMGPFLLSLLLILALTLAHFSTEQNSASKAPQLNQLYIRVPEFIEHAAFGHREIIADAFWLRALQDMDVCEDPVGKTYCRGESWLFHLLKKITDLSPHFRIVYAIAAVTLSVVVNDQYGAKYLFEKGVAEFPEDWPILYRAAYFYIYEDFNPQKAADLLRRTAEKGGPAWTVDLALRLENPETKRKLAEFLITDLSRMQHSEKAIEKIKKHLSEGR